MGPLESADLLDRGGPRPLDPRRPIPEELRRSAICAPLLRRMVAEGAMARPPGRVLRVRVGRPLCRVTVAPAHRAEPGAPSKPPRRRIGATFLFVTALLPPPSVTSGEASIAEVVVCTRRCSPRSDESTRLHRCRRRRCGPVVLRRPSCRRSILFVDEDVVAAVVVHGVALDAQRGASSITRMAPPRRRGSNSTLGTPLVHITPWFVCVGPAGGQSRVPGSQWRVPAKPSARRARRRGDLELCSDAVARPVRR